MRYLFLLTSLFSVSVLFAQEKAFHYHLGARSHFGFFLTNSQILDYLTHQHLRAYEVYIEKKTDGSKQWQQEYKFPTIGLGFLTTDYQNKKHLGTAFSLYPYMKFNILQNESIRLDFHAGAGMAYLSKRFDAELNRKNVAIGSKINMSFSFLLEADWKILEALYLNTGFALNHFSNTSFQKPNQGLNIPSFEIGLEYAFGELEKKESQKNETIKGNWQFSVHAAIAVNEIYPANGRKYLAKILSLNVDKQSNNKSRIGGSVDLFYNPANIQILKNDSISLSKNIENLQIGISLQHTLLIGRFGLHTAAGYYLKTTYKDGGLFYQKIGGRYWISDKVAINLLLKTHFASAEYLEIGMGYFFGRVN